MKVDNTIPYQPFYTSLHCNQGSLAMKDNERVASSVHNARVLRDLASKQFDRRKEFKDKLLAGRSRLKILFRLVIPNLHNIVQRYMMHKKRIAKSWLG